MHENQEMIPAHAMSNGRQNVQIRIIGFAFRSALENLNRTGGRQMQTSHRQFYQLDL